MINLTNNQIEEIAEYAMRSYEFNCSWRDAYLAACEYARDEFGKVRTSAIKLALRIAQTRWEAVTIKTSQELSQ